MTYCEIAGRYLAYNPNFVVLKRDAERERAREGEREER